MKRKRPMRVLYVTHNSNLTGASRSLLDLLAALDRDKVEPVAVLRKKGPLEDKLVELRVPYIVVPYAFSVTGAETKVPAWAFPFFDRMASNKIASYARKNDFDLIHCNSLLVDVGMRAARACELPYVVHVRDLVTEDHSMVFRNEVQTRDLIAHASVNLFISRFVESKFSSWIGCAPYEVLHDAVAIGGFKGRPNPPFTGDRPLRLIMPSRFQEMKGQLEAIKAVEIACGRGVPCELKLLGTIGEPLYYEECCSYVKTHKLDYVRIEHFTDDMAAEYAQSDITLVCSKAEAMGRVTIEGMQTGCLVIGADAGATSELICDRHTGLLYQSGNVESLAEAIIWASKNPEKAAKISSFASNRASVEFDRDAYAASITGLYERLLVEQSRQLIDRDFRK